MAVLAALLVVLVAAVGLMIRSYTAAPPPSAIKGLAKSARPVAVAPFGPKLNLPAKTRMVFYGDSWTTGYSADRGKGFVDVLTKQNPTWTVTRLSEGSSTGYLNPGSENKGTFGKRLLAVERDPSVSVFVMQGGLNDENYLDDPIDVNKAVAAAIRTAKVKFPNAQIVLLGPLSPKVDGSNGAAEVDERMQFEGERAGVDVISPFSEEWFGTPQLVDKYINEKTFHPDNLGHAYYARRLMADFRKLAGQQA